MDEKIKLIVKTLGDERVRIEEEIAPHTFLGRGGKAIGFYIATVTRELVNILNLLFELKIPFLVIGSGTKILFDNKKIDSFVVKNRTSSIKIAGIKGMVGKEGLGIEEALIEVDSGVSINKLNQYLKEQKLEEVTGFSSMYSTIGGAIFFDKSLRDIVQKIKVWDQGETVEIDLAELGKKEIVLSGVFKFKSVLKKNII